MELIRIGDKVVSKDKLMIALDDMLDARARGATQEEAAARAGVPRSFVSNLETLGTLRSGDKVAFIAFPVDNASEAMDLAARYGIELALAFSQDDRERVSEGTAGDMFNWILETMATLRSFDTIVVAASDYRIDVLDQIFDGDIVGITLGESPITSDQTLDLSVLENVFKELTAAPKGERSHEKSVHAPEEALSALKIAKRWLSLRK